jgi:hypothetical protein
VVKERLSVEVPADLVARLQALIRAEAGRI